MLHKMKGIDLFCASQASTAIYHSMEEGSSSTAHLAGTTRAIDRYNPIIRDQRRCAAPCSSRRPPITPKSYHQLNRQPKTRSRKQDGPTEVQISGGESAKQSVKKCVKQSGKQCVKQSGERGKSSCSKPTVVLSQYQKSGSLWSPPGSTRYLLSDEPAFEVVSDFDRVLTLVPVEDKESDEAAEIKKDGEIAASKTTPSPSPSSSSSSSPSPPHPDQVVVLKVSLHCKGCAGKVRKHISRMQGVTSFNIDFVAKKVTVVGDVTPLDVLASISKVKSARLLTSENVSSIESNHIKPQKRP